MIEIKFVQSRLRLIWTIFIDSNNKTGEFSDRVNFQGIEDKDIYKTYLDCTTLVKWQG